MSDMSEGADRRAPDDTASDSEPSPRQVGPEAKSPTVPMTEEIVVRAGRVRLGRSLSHPWGVAVPVIALCVFLAIVLTYVFTGGPGNGGLPAGGKVAPTVASLTGDYVSSPTSPIPMYVELSQDGKTVSGELTIPDVAPTSEPPRLVDTTEPITGEVEGSVLSLVIHQGATQSKWSGSIADGAFDVKLATGTVSFTRGTLAQFQVLLAKESAALVSQADLSSNRAAQSNLVNALTEVKALYQVKQSYADGGHPYDAAEIATQAPEFSWRDGPCVAKPSTCVSFAVIDVAVKHDSQGIALATYSVASSTCYYAVDLEVTPKLITKDAVAFYRVRGGADASVKAAGDYYARSPAGGSPASCDASLVTVAHKASWGTSFDHAGSLS